MDIKNIFGKDIFESARETLKRCPKKDRFKRINEIAIKIINTADFTRKNLESATRPLNMEKGNTVIIEKET